jgi:hypothetical protein
MTVLTLNGNQINGSGTLVEAPETNHIYTISNTVLVNIALKDVISLLFWTDDTNNGATGCHVGNPATIIPTVLLPNGTAPVEATASIVITRIS